jgi:Domain of unknown function (DUF4394)
VKVDPGVRLMSETASAGVTVNLAPEQAFDLFARRLGAWWPPEYSWSQDVLDEIGIEPHEGGMCFERGPHGFRCDWGRVQTGHSSSKGDGRSFYATDNQGNLVSFSADNPRELDSMRKITGLPAGVTLTGIDFRPRTGDLYGIGSDSVVYRVNPQTAIAVSESSTTPPTPFAPVLRGRFFGVDFNPMVDRIRVTSDANQNIRLHPDDANVVGADADLNPGDPTVVGSAYTNSSFSAGLAPSTVLYALDALDDAIYVQSPPNNGTLAMPRQLAINVRGDSGFDVAAGTTSATSPQPRTGGRARSSTASTS